MHFNFLDLSVQIFNFDNFKNILIKIKITLLTPVYVSNETGKNPQAVRQHGDLDLMITNIRSLRNNFPYLSMGKYDHKLLYTALAMLILSCIKQSQLYVNINSWHMQPIKWNVKIIRFALEVSSYRNCITIIPIVIIVKC